MRQAAYEITDGEQKAEITVITLSLQAGSLVDNVNRWRGQVGLADESADAIQEQSESITVGKYTGTWIEIWPDDGTPESPSIIAAIVKTDQHTWFFKLLGNTATARAEVDNFRQFVRTFPIP